jgi:hypothetical protein
MKIKVGDIVALKADLSGEPLRVVSYVNDDGWFALGSREACLGMFTEDDVIVVEQADVQDFFLRNGKYKKMHPSSPL